VLLDTLRFALRSLRHTPGFTATAVMTLALGIGANTAIFSAVRTVLLRPTPLGAPERLVIAWESHPERNMPVGEVSHRNFVDWRELARSFDGLAAMSSVNWNMLLEGAGDPTRVPAAGVSASFFDLLGTGPAIGRVFHEEDDRPGAARVVVLSDGSWRSRFGGDPGLIGRTVTLDGEPFTVVGVMPAAFRYPDGAELWTPVVPALARASRRWGVDALAARFFGMLFVIGRLKGEVSLAQARAELDQIVRALPAQGPAAAGRAPVVALTPLLDHNDGRARRALGLLFATVCFVLFIACANVSGLLLMRATSRQRATAIRLALGATRGRIVAEWLAETAIAAAAAGVLGVLLSGLCLQLVIAVAPPGLPHVREIAIDAGVLGYAVLLCAAAAAVCGIVPALQASSLRLAPALAAGSRASEGRASRRVRHVLIVAELAVATVLLMGAVLLVRSFVNIRGLDLGFRAANLLTLDVEPLTDTNAAATAAYDAILRRVRALPGVESAGAVYLRPLAHGPIGLESGFLLEGQSIERPAEWQDNPHLNFQTVTPGYFETMGITLRRGRLLLDRDSAGAPGVVVVSERTAQRLWPGRDPIGRRLSVASAGRDSAGAFTWQTVVGVVSDVRYRGLDDVRLDLYMSAAQSPQRPKHLIVKTTGDPLLLAAAVREAVRRAAGHAVVERVTTMEEIVAAAEAPWRFSMTMFVLLAGVAVGLAAVGLFALVGDAVTQRTREFAIRIALGARPRDVMRIVLGQGVRTSVAGIVLGGAASLAVTRSIATLLFGVDPLDPPTFGAVAMLIGTVTLAAACLAARRATRIQAVTELRA
jgi:putative ABC transport system permease protein